MTNKKQILKRDPFIFPLDETGLQATWIEAASHLDCCAQSESCKLDDLVQQSPSLDSRYDYDYSKCSKDSSSLTLQGHIYSFETYEDEQSPQQPFSDTTSQRSQSEEFERRAKQLAVGRQASGRYRRKQKQYLAQMESHIEYLTQDNILLQRKIKFLCHQVSVLSNEVFLLQKRSEDSRCNGGTGVM